MNKAKELKISWNINEENYKYLFVSTSDNTSSRRDQKISECIFLEIIGCDCKPLFLCIVSRMHFHKEIFVLLELSRREEERGEK